MKKSMKTYAFYFSKMSEESLKAMVEAPADADEDEVSELVTDFVTEWFDQDDWELNHREARLEGHEEVDDHDGQADLTLRRNEDGDLELDEGDEQDDCHAGAPPLGKE